ncbi:unnamed protein product [Kuraishia capsulata CBS 1993]|uniref:Flavin reductase like domain-containing protein n=1 Tax=Kuraishia capsulata CBS 1993 TaxID=1382522 RepID=W6MQH3_9ASCO|nr:uncharacterized protein KUCA_T00004551001 [Kuraishia capsulata CBS 1993]CDK28568.1 unnamed protein product [Kuraishia capsulata CBS 1993]
MFGALMRYSRCYSSLSRPELFKEAMSSMGSQAMILTAPFRGETVVSQLHGMTISSVSSLCVLPDPLVQFNLQIPSITSATLHDIPHFAIHIMPPTQKSVEIARSFSKGTQTTKDDHGNVIHTRPFSLIPEHEWTSHRVDDECSIPILRSAERVLICSKCNVFEVLNHEIWVARVQEIIVHEEFPVKTGGLIYFNRRFHGVGGQLKE